jgi:hypothetical protein
MMEKALVMKVKKEYVLVLDDQSRYLRLKYKAGIEKGQQIYYSERDLYKKQRVNYRMALAAVAALVLVSFTLTSQLPIANALPLMTVSIDVNPSVEMDVDAEMRVTEIRAMNQDAEPLIQNSWEGKKYDIVMREYMKALKDSGYLQTNEEILFGYAWLDKDREPDRTMQGELQSMGQGAIDEINRENGRLIRSLHVQSSEQERLQAKENQVSIGKDTVMNRLRIQTEPGKEAPNVEELNKSYRNYSQEQEKGNERQEQQQKGSEDSENLNQDPQQIQDQAPGNDQTQVNKPSDSDGGQNGDSGGSGNK